MRLNCLIKEHPGWDKVNNLLAHNTVCVLVLNIKHSCYLIKYERHITLGVTSD